MSISVFVILHFFRNLEEALLATKVSLSLSTTGATPCSEIYPTANGTWGAITLAKQL